MVNMSKPVEGPPTKNVDAYEKRQQLEEQAWALWRQVCASVKSLCSALNAEYGKAVITNQTDSPGAMSAQLSIAGSVSKLSATFDATSVSCALKWFYSGPAGRTSPDGRCRIYVHNGTVAFQANATPYTAEAIAKKMFDGLLSE